MRLNPVERLIAQQGRQAPGIGGRSANEAPVRPRPRGEIRQADPNAPTGGKPYATFVVAASDSVAADAAAADYVCDGSADQVEISQAITAATTLGGSVCLLEGTFNLSAAIVTDGGVPGPPNAQKRVVKLFGQGYGTHLKAVANNMLLLDYGYDFIVTNDGIVADLRFSGAGQTGVNGLYLWGPRTLVERCWFESLTTGVELDGASNADYLQRVSRNFFKSCTTAVKLNAASFGSEVAGNFFDAGGIAVDVAGQKCAVRDNYVKAATGDAAIRLGLNSGYVMVSGNLVRDGDKHGIQALGDQYHHITDNFVVRCGQAADSTYDGIILDGVSDSHVQGNMVRHDFVSNRHRYGINITAASSRNFVTNNDLLDAGRTGNFNDAGTSTVTAAGNRT